MITIDHNKLRQSFTTQELDRIVFASLSMFKMLGLLAERPNAPAATDIRTMLARHGIALVDAPTGPAQGRQGGLG